MLLSEEVQIGLQNSIREIAMQGAKLIKFVDKTMYFSIICNGRTDEEIDSIFRMFKVRIILLLKEDIFKIKYKVEE